MPCFVSRSATTTSFSVAAADVVGFDKVAGRSWVPPNRQTAWLVAARPLTSTEIGVPPETEPSLGVRSNGTATAAIVRTAAVVPYSRPSFAALTRTRRGTPPAMLPTLTASGTGHSTRLDESHRANTSVPEAVLLPSPSPISNRQRSLAESKKRAPDKSTVRGAAPVSAR